MRSEGRKEIWKETQARRDKAKELASSGDKKCGICGLGHFTKDCFELDQNKSRRGQKWKSIFN